MKRRFVYQDAKSDKFGILSLKVLPKLSFMEK